MTSSRIVRRPAPARRGLTAWCLAAAALAVAACGSAAQGDSPNTAPSAPSSSRSVLVQSDMLQISGSTVYDAISQLRPQWFRSRGGDAPAVFIDGRPAGDLGTLRSIRILEAEQVRFYSAREATTKWGTGYPGGVIEVERVR